MKAYQEILSERERHFKEIERLNREIEDFKERVIRRREEINKLAGIVEEYDLIIKTLSPMFKEDNND